MDYDTTLDSDRIDRLLATVAPDWTVEQARPTEAGHHTVYHLVVDTPEGRRECYLKATPAGKDPTVHVEARLLAALDRHTKLPVPAVLGAVDEHPELPAPFHLTAAMPGELHQRSTLAGFDADRHRAIAREIGRYLAELHRLDAVDAFGFLDVGGPALDGEPPAGDLDAIAVADPVTDWRERLHAWADDTLAGVEATRFVDVAPEAEPVLREQIDALEDPFEPALARVDQAIENCLLDGRSVAALLDWEFTIAATPAYDCCCVAWSLAGGPYLFDASVADRRDAVLDALLAGYTDAGPDRIAEQARANRECYELLAALRSMVHLQDWFELFDLDARVDDAAAALRADVRERVNRTA